MADWDSLSYDIKDKMPEWWKHDAFLEPINRYSQELIRDLIGGLLTNLGVVQPFQVWKTLPTEYSWTHTYRSHEEWLLNKQGGTTSLVMHPNEPVIAKIPNSKRNCHGIIQLQLTGDNQGMEKPLKKLTIKNANQVITLNNITTTTDIKIFTEDGSILIDGVSRSDLVKGKFNKIYGQAKNTNYNELDVDDENKITYLEIESDTQVTFNLQVKLIHPVYVTEQNIRVHTVSAFPIEYIKLYGFYCYDFNNKQEWKFLWEKQYSEDERVVYDRITKQFDCETFYIQVKLHGIGVPFVYGFPQEQLHSNPAFQINQNLDKWGKILGLPRRYYKTHISDDEEPYTYPPFYKYDVEQDFWYEQRLVNEYCHNDDAINARYIKDTNLNNVAMLQCIDPFIHDLYVYTETIQNDIDNNRQTNDIYPTQLSESGEGITWDKPYALKTANLVASEVVLQPQTSEYVNDYQYQTKVLEIKFDDIPELPKNINIKGIELQLHGMTDIHSQSLKLDDRSQMLLPHTYIRPDNTVFKTIDNIQINNEIQYWEKGKGIYSIGGKNYLFGVSEIKREQIQNGITFHLGFTNTNTFLKSSIILYGIKLYIYYEIIYDNYTIDVELDRKEIVLNDDNKQQIQMKINLENIGEIPVVNKNIYIAVPPELTITNNKFPPIDLDVGEPFTVGELESDKIIIKPNADKLTGLYDIIVFCDDKVIRNEITVRGGF